MVKGAAKAAASTSAPTPPRLPQMGTGLNVSGNPADNVENIHHASFGLVIGIRRMGTDRTGSRWFQPFPRNGHGQHERPKCCESTERLKRRDYADVVDDWYDGQPRIHEDNVRYDVTPGSCRAGE